MEKCICIQEELTWFPNDKRFDINLGGTYLFDKVKIKFNIKSGTFKKVKPNQMGTWRYSIYHINGDLINTCQEKFFNEHFSTKQFDREEKLNQIIS